jgi:amino acid adenylation domain-containing protein
VVIGADVLAGLKEISKQQRSTLFMTLMAAYHVWLYRHSRQEDILVGTATAGRSRPEFATVVGDFINPVVIRSNLSGNPSFVEFLGSVRQKVLGAFDHQDFPFPLLVEKLAPARDPSRSPVFQTMFILQRAQAGSDRSLSKFMTGTGNAAMSFSGISAEAVEVDQHDAQFDISLTVAESGDSLNCQFQYNTDLFDRETVRRMIDRFAMLLKAIAADPARPISRIPILPDDERARLVDTWNATAVDYPRDLLPVQLFERQAARTPDAVAVVGENETLTYAQLNVRANKFAQHLRALGVGIETLVAVSTERTPNMLAAILGIWKAGGAYVPLDPSFPQSRLAYMLQNSEASVLVTERSVRGLLPEYAGHIVMLDDDWAAIEARDSAELPQTAHPENLAYVLYTSGSTGNPKGVEVPHQAVVNFLHSMAKAPGLKAGDGVLAITTLSFDISVLELYLPLTVGARVVLVSRGHSGDGPWLAEHIERSGVTVVQATPATYRLLLASGWNGGKRLKLLCGGEALPRDLAQTLLERSGELWNVYGPTETTVWSTVERIAALDGPLSIGRPIDNTQVYLLDDLLELVPTGSPGELWIGGDGVARGYRFREDLTAERFVRDPFRNVIGARIYRTGDVARRLADGRLECLGRVDHQVKVRGFRIELGEIEAVLAEHPSVRTGVVHTVKRGGDVQLVGYVVPRGTQPSVEDLQKALRTKLPEYMIPQAFVFLAELPRTPNGKIDRKALPEPDLGGDRDYVAPRTATETEMAALWSEVLGVERVGATDDFFRLGGHSLKAAQMNAKIRERFGVVLPLKGVFEDPTVGGVAALVDKLKGGGSSPAAPAAPPQAKPAASAKPAAETDHTHITVDYRPPLTLFAAGKLAKVDAVALAYLPSTILQHTGDAPPEFVVEAATQGLPLVVGVQETSLGRIGGIMLPQFDYQLYQDPQAVVDQTLDALEIAKHLGAKMVSLTGLLPSATEYGRALAAAAAGRDLPAMTTGHATTTATVVLSIRKALERAGRDLTGEHVAFLGLGSVGMSTLRLMLTVLPHPARISLCDIYSQRERLVALVRELVAGLNFRGRIDILESRKEAPAELYEARVIIGATNVTDVLDIGRLQPGTVVVDDSAPHCFRTEDAWKRLAEKGDILFTEGGVLTAPAAIPQTAYVPPVVGQLMNSDPVSMIAQTHPRHITGCILSSVLTLRKPELKATIGLVENAEAELHYRTLGALGYDAGAMHCEGKLLDEAAIETFRKRFGR